MEKSPSSGVLWCDIISQVSDLFIYLFIYLSSSLPLSQILDDIPPHESLELKCTLLPVLPGIQVNTLMYMYMYTVDQ